MKLFSSGRSKSHFTPTTLGLPIGTLTYQTDATTHERTEIVNPDLPALLAKFAYYLHQRSVAGDSLSGRVFEQWLRPYLKTNPSSPTTPLVTSGSYVLKDDLQTLPQLFAAIRDSTATLGSSAPLVFLGLYLFSAWHFLVDTKEVVSGYTVFNERVRRYIATQCQTWVWRGWAKADVRLKPDFILDMGTTIYAAPFLHQMEVRGYKISNMSQPNTLGDIDLLFDTATIPGFKPSAAEDADFAFVTFYRDLFTDLLKAEFSSLLCETALDTVWNITNIGCYAVGEGGTTKGFFGVGDLGTIFFNYAGDKARSKAEGLFTPLRKRQVPVWADGSAGTPSVFLAQWGADEDQATVAVTIGPTTYPQTLGLNPDSAFLTEPPCGSEFNYEHSTGLLTFSRPPSGPVVLTYNTVEDPGSHMADEISYFTLSFVARTPFTQVSPPDPRLRIDWLFADNEFVIPTTTLLGFWTPSWPSVTSSEGAAEQDTLNTLILRMRDSTDFMITSQIAGMGIGERIDMFESDEFQSDLVPAVDQSDNQVPNTVAVKNQFLRYAYGEVTWKTGQNGDPDVLNLCTEGFASPLRCTWDIWPAFQSLVAGSSTVTKAAALQADIGQYVRTSNNLPAPYRDMPSYNMALSTLRAFGMMEAMVKRLEDCADDLTPAQLSPAQRDQIKATLEAFLHLQASTHLIQVGRDRMTDIVIDYAMFLKYGY